MMKSRIVHIAPKKVTTPMTEFFIWIILATLMVCVGFANATAGNNASAWFCIGGSLISVILAAISAIYP